jgi:hypothetical protein
VLAGQNLALRATEKHHSNEHFSSTRREGNAVGGAYPLHSRPSAVVTTDTVRGVASGIVAQQLHFFHDRESQTQ